MKKRFIEWDLPLAEISKESAREKSIRHGHPSTLHVWWARRPLASSRTTNFAALIDLPDDLIKRKKIQELIKSISPWESVKNGNNDNIKIAQKMIKTQWGQQIPKILDPFSGGGTIPLEALRLGCETYANDYNPVAVLIEKATIEWPQKYGIMIPHPEKKPGIDGEIEEINLLSYMITKWGNKISEQVKEEIDHFYPKESDGSDSIGYIWLKTIPCQNPNCQSEIPLVKRFWLAKKEKKIIAFKPVINNDKKIIEFEIVEKDLFDFNPDEGTVKAGKTKCLICGNIIGKEVMKLGQEGKIKERLVVIIISDQKRKGKRYRIANNNDLKLFKEAEIYLEKKISDWPFLDSPLPNEKIYDDDIDKTPQWLWINKYGYPLWADLFNSRQKLALICFLEKIKLSYDKIKKECENLELEKYGLESEFTAKAIMGYIGIIFDRLVDSLSKQNFWISVGEKPAGTFGKQALQMLWDYLENNAINSSARSWDNHIKWIIKFINFASKINNEIFNSKVFISNYPAQNLNYPNNYFDAIFTDPPYYDNVPYADLSDYFYVWLKRSIGDIFPDLFSTPTTLKNQEAVANPFRQSDAIKFFENALSESFREIHRVLKPEGITVIVYGHKTTAGWETMLNSLINAKLVVTASWPIHTERSIRLRGQGFAALASSIYMICRKIKIKKIGFYNELQPKIKKSIETKLQQFWNNGISGGDFFISTIGPGMEIFSQYERVEKLSGEQVTTIELLDYIRSISTDFIVNKLLKDASSTKIDKESEFYLAYRWTYLDNTVEYDDARKLASASGFSLENNWGSGGFIKKSGSKISVLGPKERDEIKSPKNMVDVMHKCLLLWKNGQKEDILELLQQTGFKEEPAFKQYCQAIAECLLNGNKEKQLLEGFLMGIDGYLKIDVKISKDQTDLKQFGGR